MTECEFCGEEFDTDTELQAHWREHEDELNSHQEEKAKKAERELQQQKEDKMAKRKRYGGYGLAALGGLAVVGLLFSQAGGPGAVLGALGGGSADTQINTTGQPVLGSSDAEVTVVAFEDYKCGYCKQFSNGVKPQLTRDYIDSGEVKFVMYNFPILGQQSTDAAISSECVAKQSEEGFYNYSSALFKHTGSFNTEGFMEVARSSTDGLDYGQLETCIANGNSRGEVTTDRREGQSLGVSGTPAVYINGQQVSNPLDYPSLKARIESEISG
jgi:Protein-disulfide isomerase